MGRPTQNLTAPYAVRLRHDQRVKIANLIKSMSSDDLEELINTDQSKFTHPAKFKNRGRASNPMLIVMRAAIDEYLDKRLSEQSGAQLLLFGTADE